MALLPIIQTGSKAICGHPGIPRWTIPETAVARLYIEEVVWEACIGVLWCCFYIYLVVGEHSLIFALVNKMLKRRVNEYNRDFAKSCFTSGVGQ